MANNFDSEIEKQAFEFCVNWLSWNIAYTEFRENKHLQQRITVKFVNGWKKAADDSMLDLFEALGKKYQLPGVEE